MITRRKKTNKVIALRVNPKLVALGFVAFAAFGGALYALNPNAGTSVDVCSQFKLVNVEPAECPGGDPLFYRFDIVPVSNAAPVSRVNSAETTIPVNIDALVRLDSDPGAKAQVRIFDRERAEWSDWHSADSLLRITAGMRIQLSLETPRATETSSNVRLVTLRNQTVAEWSVTTGRASDTERLTFSNVNILNPAIEVVSEAAQVNFTRTVALRLISGVESASIRVLDRSGSPRTSWLIAQQEFTVVPGDAIELRVMSPENFGDTHTLQIQRVEDGRVIGNWQVRLASQFNWRTGSWSRCPIPTLGEWGEWSTCSAACNGGFQTRTRNCIPDARRSQTRSIECIDANGARVADSLCTETRPIEEQACRQLCDEALEERRTCNTQACSGYSWNTGEWSSCLGVSPGPWSAWSACSASCGEGTQSRSRVCVGTGQQSRQVRCVDADGNIVAPTLCTGTAPDRFQTCEASQCEAELEQTRSCSTTCPDDRDGVTRTTDPFAKSDSTSSSAGSSSLPAPSPRPGPSAPGGENDDSAPSQPPPVAPPREMSSAGLCLLALDDMKLQTQGQTTISGPTCSIHAGKKLEFSGAYQVNLRDLCAGEEVVRSRDANITTGTDPICNMISDPYARRIPNVSVSGLVPRSGGLNVSFAPNATATLQPGLYNESLTFQGDWTVTFSPGVYVFRGGFRMTGSVAHATGSGVTIYLENDASFVIDASESRLSLSAPTDGTYDELLLSQSGNGRIAVRDTGGGTGLKGLIHAPLADIELDLNGTLPTYEARFVGRRINIDNIGTNWSIAPSTGRISD